MRVLRWHGAELLWKQARAQRQHARHQQTRLLLRALPETEHDAVPGIGSAELVIQKHAYWLLRNGGVCLAFEGVSVGKPLMGGGGLLCGTGACGGIAVGSLVSACP